VHSIILLIKCRGVLECLSTIVIDLTKLSDDCLAHIVAIFSKFGTKKIVIWLFQTDW
jgi:hypothetical protein